MTPIITENANKTCPSCGATMTDKHSNLYPTWSDRHDEIVCWLCAHHEPETTYLVTFTAPKPVRSITFAATTTDPADAKSLAYDNLIELIGYDEARQFTHTTTTEENK